VQARNWSGGVLLAAEAGSPVIEQIFEGLFEGDGGFPIRGEADLFGAAVEHGNVGGAEAGGILADLDFPGDGLGEEEVEDFLDGPGATGAEVVDLAGFTALQEEPIAADNITDVGVVAAGFKIADLEDGFASAEFDFGDLAGKVGGDENFTTAGAFVVEGAGTDAGDAVVSEVLEAEVILGNFADCVRGEGAERGFLGDGEVAGLDQAVFLAGAHDEDSGEGFSAIADGFQEVDLADGVGGQGFGRGMPGGGDVALTGEVDDGVGTRGGEHFLDGGDVADIGFDHVEALLEMIDVLGVGTPAAGAEDLGVLSEGEFGEVTADETGDPGDEEPHGREYGKGNGWMSKRWVTCKMGACRHVGEAGSVGEGVGRGR